MFLSEIIRFNLIQNLINLIRIFQKILILVKKVFRLFHPFVCLLGDHLPFILFFFKFLLENNFNKMSQNIVNYQFSIIMCFKCGEKLINFDIEILVDKVGENLSLVLRSPIPNCGLECQQFFVTSFWNNRFGFLFLLNRDLILYAFCRHNHFFKLWNYGRHSHIFHFWLHHLILSFLIFHFTFFFHCHSPHWCTAPICFHCHSSHWCSFSWC